MSLVSPSVGQMDSLLLVLQEYVDALVILESLQESSKIPAPVAWRFRSKGSCFI